MSVNTTPPRPSAKSVAAESWEARNVAQLAPGTRFVGPNPAAALLGLSTSTILRMIHSGELRASRYGGRWLIPREEIDRWADDQLRGQSPLA